MEHLLNEYQLVVWKETKIKQTHQKKLYNLRMKQYSMTFKQKSNISPITNLSKRTLTNDEVNILENGLNFVLPAKKFDEMAFMSNIETFFVNLVGHCTDKKDFDDIDVDERITYNLTPVQLQYASKIRSICSNFHMNAEKIINKHKSEIIKTEKVLKNLSNDKSICIIRPDKGKGIVLMDKEDYNNKMLEILNDTDTFQIVESDLTISQEDKLTRKLKQLKKRRLYS